LEPVLEQAGTGTARASCEKPVLEQAGTGTARASCEKPVPKINKKINMI
jgi:hypothetical protein